MSVLIIAIGVVLAYFLIKGWIRFVNWILPSPKPKHNMENPYIQAHLLRRANDDAYDDYIDWLDKDGGGLPIDKLKTKEEARFERELNKSI